MTLVYMVAAFLAAVGVVGFATMWGIRSLAHALKPTLPLGARINSALALLVCVTTVLAASIGGFTAIRLLAMPTPPPPATEAPAP
jgi:hypothetical protein